MLTPSQHAAVEASLPLVTANATAITGRFYARLFEAHSELRNLFNQGNQVSGEQKQALASAVYAYAKNYRNRERLAPLLSRIAHKHASLGVGPEMYSIVGEHLIAAIGEILGSKLTADVADAWRSLYWRFADDLIAREAALYRGAGITPGHSLREYRVVERVLEGEIAVSLRLVPTDGKPPPSFRPGQYVSIRVELVESGLRQLRQYSLSDAPDGRTLRITFKPECGGPERPGGLVSAHLLRHAHVGSRWLVSAPFGDLAFDTDVETPVVMISAGVGITPVMAMRNHLVSRQPGRRGIFVHVAAHGGKQILKSELAPAANVVHLLVYDAPRPQDRLGTDFDFAGVFRLVDHAETVLVPDADYYLCGPLPFMIAQRDALSRLGVSLRRVHFEVFGPDLLTASLPQ
jgi:nitric oxide dioxygenase